MMREDWSDGQRSRAWYSECETYRYGLERRWASGPSVLWVMLNPSTATETRNDPTIERCQRRSRALGFGTMRIANLFALRATKPAALRQSPDPEGPGNRALLLRWSAAASLTVAGWGIHGALRNQARRLAPELIGDVRHLGLTRDGHPRHPLYISYACKPQPWPRDRRYA